MNIFEGETEAHLQSPKTAAEPEAFFELMRFFERDGEQVMGEILSGLGGGQTRPSTGAPAAQEPAPPSVRRDLSSAIAGAGEDPALAPSSQGAGVVFSCADQ